MAVGSVPRIVNKTPWPKTCGDATYEPDGEPARVIYEEKSMGKVGGVPCYRRTPKQTIGLPLETSGVLLIVDQDVWLANWHRTDLLLMEGTIRDEKFRAYGGSYWLVH